MISISGIKYQKELEKLPFLNKEAASVLIGKTGKNLDKKISRLIKVGYLEVLKKGFYVSSVYAEKAARESYTEYAANILRSPSYISGEYVLAKEGLIPESVFMLTSITVKTPRLFSNFLGRFSYQNIKLELFCGYREVVWEDKVIYIASKAKALFDYFYLRKVNDAERDVFDLRLNWNNFFQEDLDEFAEYVNLLPGRKMARVLKWIGRNYAHQ